MYYQRNPNLLDVNTQLLDNVDSFKLNICTIYANWHHAPLPPAQEQRESITLLRVRTFNQKF